MKIKDPLGEWHEFEGDSKKSIIAQCEERGIDCPFACRAGACTVCACKVNKGEQHLIQNHSGQKLIDLPEGKFLTCIGGVANVDGAEVELEF